MSDMGWSDIARTTIQVVFDELKAKYPKLSNGQILDIVSKDYYPFGQRAMWPYKAWCAAMKKAG